jgi:hypothetical protein
MTETMMLITAVSIDTMMLVTMAALANTSFTSVGI